MPPVTATCVAVRPSQRVAAMSRLTLHASTTAAVYLHIRMTAGVMRHERPLVILTSEARKDLLSHTERGEILHVVVTTLRMTGAPHGASAGERQTRKQIFFANRLDWTFVSLLLAVFCRGLFCCDGRSFSLNIYLCCCYRNAGGTACVLVAVKMQIPAWK